MVIRNRLLALLLRIALFAGYVSTLVLVWPEYSSFWVAFSTFSFECGLLLSIITGFEIIFTLIDLRNGIHGVPAGPYMPIALPLYSLSILGGILYFSAQIPTGSAPVSTAALIFHVLLIAGPLIDWIGLDEKGTVRFAAGFTAQLYPILFFIFGYFRTVIWNETPIYGTHMYSYTFLNFTDPNIVWNAVLFFLMTLGIVSITILLNNLFAGKYGFARKQRDY